MAEGPKTILITGSTDGVGRRVAERLAGPGVRLVIHGRDRARGESLKRAIEKAGGEAALHLADLSSLEETRRLAETVLRSERRLDVLVNNAGIGTGGDKASRRESRDGHELTFAINYLAGFLLTRLLLPLLKASAPARIVNVASAGQQALDFSDVMLIKGYSGPRAYRQSKLAQILFTVDLAEELKGTGVTANALHPATFMDTTMVRNAGVSPISTVDEGADAILQLVEAPELASESGLYFNGLRRARADAQAYDIEARRKLRELSSQAYRLALIRRCA